VSEYWYVNSQGTILHELRPDVTLSGTAVARHDGTIEKDSSRSGCAAAGTRCRTGRRFREVAERAVQLLDAPMVKGGTYP